MKKRYFETVLNGENFTFDNKATEKPKYTIWDYATIFDAYNKPSLAKEIIWNKWCAWFRELIINNLSDDYTMFIDSRNCFQFTITGYFNCPLVGYTIAFHITKCKNVFWIAK